MPGLKTVISIRDQRPSQNLASVGHGSCVVSKIAGPRYGVAKNIRQTIVYRLPDRVRGSDFIDAFYGISEHVHENNLRGKAVVNMSWRCKYTYPSIGKHGSNIDRSRPGMGT